MSEISVAVMAHPKRREMVHEHLLPHLPDGTHVCWDTQGVEIETARRAIGSFDRLSRWHLVLQDDAVLCQHFMSRVAEALECVMEEHPASFYLGAPMPHGNEMGRAVAEANQQNRRWIVTRGPMWGVAVAYPTAAIPELLEKVGTDDVPYDEAISEFFWSKRIECWYSVPSLADHRDTPSLLPGRQAVPRRARLFSDDPADFDRSILRITDPTEPWARQGLGYRCMWCGAEFEILSAIVQHHVEEHEAIQKVDFLAGSPETAAFMVRIWKQLGEEERGKVYLLGMAAEGEMHRTGVDYEVGTATKMKRMLSRDPTKPFTITDYEKNLRFLGLRSGWSLDGHGN